MTVETIKDFSDGAVEVTPSATEALPPLNPNEVIGSDASGLDPEFNQGEITDKPEEVK